MVWARIPPDKLVHLPLFGIDVIAEEDGFIWMRGPEGRMCVDKRAPRILFESVADAHQAGATAIRIGCQEDMAAIEALAKREPKEEPEQS